MTMRWQQPIAASTSIAFVSEHFRDIVRRRVRELAGLAFLTLALLGAIALATWSVQDPSLSHATQKPIHNLLGFPGAIFSDLAMQLLGLASVLLLLPEALLGWRLLSHRPVGEKWRGLVWIVATFLAAAFVSTLPRSHAWPLPTGFGGVFGDALLHAPALIAGAPLSGLRAGRDIRCARLRHALDARDRNGPALAAHCRPKNRRSMTSKMLTVPKTRPTTTPRPGAA